MPYSSRRQNTRSKTALVLAGGGLTGAVYEIGALQAVNNLLEGISVNDFDIYVGTSAGSLVGACLASGFNPAELMTVFDGTHPHIPTLNRNHLFSFNTEEFLKRALALPANLVTAWGNFLANFNEMTVFDLFWSLIESLPSAMYTNDGLESFIRGVLTQDGRSNHFDGLEKPLYVIATDLDNGERVVFGPGYNSSVPISKAVAASTALPTVYRPVRIEDKEYVDGALRGIASLDVAIENGATLVLCINPLIPLDNSNHSAISELANQSRYLSDRGAKAVVNQTLRIFFQAGLHYHIKQLRRAHPEVDIILIEPDPDDYQMFFYNIMRYSVRQTIARHGFESVTLGMTENFRYFQGILSRHGISINRKMALAELEEIKQSGYDAAVISKVTDRLAGQPGNSQVPVAVNLRNSLTALEAALDNIAERQPPPA